jgi:ribonuclease HI
MAGEQQDTDPAASVVIYTDGGCTGNPGPGGYGAIVIAAPSRKQLSGGFRLTTNNRMEITAAIAGLEHLRRPSRVTLYSDSRYLVDAMSKGWARRWKTNGWRRGTGEPALNPDLWERLLALCDLHQVRFQWVRGHAGHPENELCDRLAVAAAGRPGLPADVEYEKARKTAPAIKEPRAAGQREAPAAPAGPNLAGASPAGRITRAGQACRKCGIPVERRTPRRRPKPGQEYCYEYYLSCPSCGTNYMVEEAKRYLNQSGGRGAGSET